MLNKSDGSFGQSEHTKTNRIQTTLQEMVQEKTSDRNTRDKHATEDLYSENDTADRKNPQNPTVHQQHPRKDVRGIPWRLHYQLSKINGIASRLQNRAQVKIGKLRTTNKRNELC